MLYRFTGEYTDSSELVAHNESFPVARELSIEGVVSHVPIYRVDTVLAVLMNDLLRLQVPEDESAAVRASHEELFEDRMRCEDPRVLLKLMTTGSRQIIVKRLIDCVPDLDPTDFFFKLLNTWLKIVVAWIFDL